MKPDKSTVGYDWMQGESAMNAQHGFTLIELMVVVAIIAILAAIAIPQYNDFTARAQLAEALSLTGAMQTPISTAYSEASQAASCALPVGTVSSGKYVASVDTANASDTNCDIVATMRSGIASKASDRTVTFNYTLTPAAGAPNWTCTTDAPAEVAPRACLP